MRDAHARQVTQNLSRIQNARERDKENPEIKEYENRPKTIPWGFLRSNFVAKFLEYLDSENVSKTLFLLLLGFSSFSAQEYDKEINFCIRQLKNVI